MDMPGPAGNSSCSAIESILYGCCGYGCCGRHCNLGLSQRFDHTRQVTRQVLLQQMQRLLRFLRQAGCQLFRIDFYLLPGHYGTAPPPAPQLPARCRRVYVQQVLGLHGSETLTQQHCLGHRRIKMVLRVGITVGGIFTAYQQVT